MYWAIYCAASWLSSVELSSTVLSFLPRYHKSIFLGFFVIADFTSRKLYFCTETLVSSINLIELRQCQLFMLSVLMFSLGFRALSHAGKRCISFCGRQKEPAILISTLLLQTHAPQLYSLALTRFC